MARVCGRCWGRKRGEIDGWEGCVCVWGGGVHVCFCNGAYEEEGGTWHLIITLGKRPFSVKRKVRGEEEDVWGTGSTECT